MSWFSLVIGQNASRQLATSSENSVASAQFLVPLATSESQCRALLVLISSYNFLHLSILYTVSTIIACTTEGTKLQVRPSVKPHQNPCSGSLSVDADLSMFHDWPVKTCTVDLRIRLKRNS